MIKLKEGMVFEVLVDWDGTLRSVYQSEGLFTSKTKANQHRRDLINTKRVSGGTKVIERRVF